MKRLAILTRLLLPAPPPRRKPRCRCRASPASAPLDMLAMARIRASYVQMPATPEKQWHAIEEAKRNNGKKAV